MIAFDSEDNSQGIVQLVNFYDGVKHETFDIKDYTDQRSFKIDLINYIYNCKDNLFIAHNLEYDLNNIFYPENLDMLEMFYKNRLLFAYLSETKKKFIDSFNFSFTSLKNLGEVVGYQKFLVDDFYNVEYNRRDCEIVYKYMNSVDNMLFDEFKIKKKNTMAGTSQNIFLRRFNKEKLLGKNIELEMLNGYYGGRCEVFTLGEIINTSIFEIDINSSYPTSMKYNIYPTGEAYITKNPETILWVAHVEIHIDEKVNIPIIPKRTEKLLFPVGRFETWVTSVEYDRAKKEGHIISCTFLKTYNFKEYDYIFSSYIDYCYEKRLVAKEDKNIFYSNFYKLMMNSVYGRFALKGDMQVLKSLEYIGVFKEEFEKFKIGEMDEAINNSNRNYAIPTFVTAYSRILLYDMIQAVEKIPHTQVIYSDTDSVYFFFTKKIDLQDTIVKLHEKLPISKKLGDYSICCYNQGCFYNAKSYIVFDFSHSYKAKCKGIKKENRKEFFEKGKTTFKKPMKLRQALRGIQGIDANIWYDFTIEQKSTYNKRKITTKHKKYFNTEPIIFNE